MKGMTREHQKTFGGMDMFTILIVVMVSWIYTYYQNLLNWPGIVVPAYNPRTLRQEDHGEFKTSLGYIASSRPT
jgi:hypothetical protein